jgi:hypothetical protein
MGKGAKGAVFDVMGKLCQRFAPAKKHPRHALGAQAQKACATLLAIATALARFAD